MLNLHNLGRQPRVHSTICRAPTARSSSRSRSARRAATSASRTTTACSSRSSTGCRGRPTADKLLRQGIAYAESKDFTWDVIGGRALLAKLLHRRGTPAEARADYEAARALAVGAGHSLVAEDCEQALATLQGKPARSASAS